MFNRHRHLNDGVPIIGTSSTQRCGCRYGVTAGEEGQGESPRCSITGGGRSCKLGRRATLQKRQLGTNPLGWCAMGHQLRDLQCGVWGKEQ